MREAFDDLRALKLYESLTSRDETLSFIKDELGEVTSHFIPEENTVYSFSEKLKNAVAELI